MANETVSISGPIDIASNSKQSVAFDLMKHIAFNEKVGDEQKKSRQYWLSLYRQCWKATNGGSLESILKEE